MTERRASNAPDAEPLTAASAEATNAEASSRRIAQQTLWLGATSGVQLAGGLVFILLATRILGAEGFGALAVIMSTSALIHSIIAIPGGDTVTTFASRSLSEGRPEAGAAVLRLALFASTALSAVAFAMIALAGMLAADFVLIGDASISSLLLYALAGVFVATEPATLAVLRLANELRTHFLVILAGAITRVAVLGAAWIAGAGLMGVVAASVAAAAVNGIGMLAAAVLLAPKAGITGLLKSSSVRVGRDVATFHLAIFGRTTAGTLYQNADSILLAQFVGAADVGLYRAARYLADLARQPFRLLATAVQPTLSRLWFDGEGAKLREAIGRFTLLSAVIAAAGFALLAWLSEEIAVMVFGDQFVGAAPLVLLLIPGTLVSSLAVPMTLPLAVGRSFPPLISAVTGSVVFLAAVWLFVPPYGGAGGALARTVVLVASSAVLVPAIIAILRDSRRL